MTSLDPEKIKIINDSGNIIVIANPGTGKTTTLAAKVIKCLEEGCKPEEILCITFTEKAKKEMFEKLMELIKNHRTIRQSDIMKLNIHTFHSFAFNYLLDRGIISGNIIGNNVLRFSILKSFDRQKALNYSRSYVISEIVPKTENAIRYIKSFGVTPEKMSIKKIEKLVEESYENSSTSMPLEEVIAFLGYFIEAYKDYEKVKKDSIDYTDLLLLFIKNFRGDRFRHVFVDEMQDMNNLEAAIAEMVGENIFIVGDVKQAIFGFQGGSIKNLTNFRKKCKLHLLGKNRRSCQQILDYAKGYFLSKTENRELFEEELRVFESEIRGAKPKIISTGSPMTAIKRIIEDHPGKKIGIITRTNNQIIEISKYLDLNNIQYSSTSSQSTTKKARDEIITFLEGMLSDSMNEKIRAAFTIFSPYTLEEAFAMTEKDEENVENDLKKMEELKRKYPMTRDGLSNLFTKHIIPVSVALGEEWFSTALLVQSQIDEYFSNAEVPNRNDLFDFLVIAEEAYSEKSKKANITLTTVHKAKGRQFEIVVYWPYSGGRGSFIDIIIESVLKSQGIDVSEELEEEWLRIDFVAFTRAKERLFILTDSKLHEKYHHEDLSEMEMDESEEEMIATKIDSRLAQAYSLFVAGREREARELLNQKDNWLMAFIERYFENLEKLSYSRITTDPYEFLTYNICPIPFFFEELDFGTEVHQGVEKICKGKAKIDDFKGDVRKAIENCLKSHKELEKDFPGLKLEGTEKWLRVPVSELTKYDGEPLEFAGKVDAVFSHNSGILIIDYKTDKTTKNSSANRQQLAVYRKMYSISEKIPEEKISVALVYPSVRGNVNTGRFDLVVDTGQPARSAYGTFEKRLQKILEWKANPHKFIDDLLQTKPADLLGEAILAELNGKG